MRQRYNTFQSNTLEHVWDIRASIEANLKQRVPAFKVAQTLPKYDNHFENDFITSYPYSIVAGIRYIYDNVAFWGNMLFVSLAQYLFFNMNDQGDSKSLNRNNNTMIGRWIPSFIKSNRLYRFMSEDMKQSRFVSSLKVLWNKVCYGILSMMRSLANVCYQGVNIAFSLVGHIFIVPSLIENIIVDAYHSNFKVFISRDYFIKHLLPLVTMVVMYAYYPLLLANIQLVSYAVIGLISFNFIRNVIADRSMSYPSLIKAMTMMSALFFSTNIALLGVVACIVTQDGNKYFQSKTYDVLMVALAVIAAPILPLNMTLILLACSPLIYHHSLKAARIMTDEAVEVTIQCLIVAQHLVVEVMYKTLFDMFQSMTRFPTVCMKSALGVDMIYGVVMDPSRGMTAVLSLVRTKDYEHYTVYGKDYDLCIERNDDDKAGSEEFKVLASLSDMASSMLR